MTRNGYRWIWMDTNGYSRISNSNSIQKSISPSTKIVHTPHAQKKHGPPTSIPIPRRGADPVQYGLLSQWSPGDVTAPHRSALHPNLAALRHFVDLLGCLHLRVGYGTFMIFYVLYDFLKCTFGTGEKNIGCWGHKLSQAKLYRLEFFTFTVVRCRYFSQADELCMVHRMWQGVSQLTMFDDRRVTLVSHSCQPTKGYPPQGLTPQEPSSNPQPLKSQ